MLHAVDQDEVAGGAVGPGAAGTGPAATERTSPHRVRIIDGTLICLARHGTMKTTVDDIARRSGVSRATVYRVFPGGRDEILGAEPTDLEACKATYERLRPSTAQQVLRFHRMQTAAPAPAA